ncbi:Uncharacterised protein [Mycobacteroides abscessus subsp. abscessus]|nr:Uncharacterised protein [Mycobacteroides abscessus subsp. abscessus]
MPARGTYSPVISLASVDLPLPLPPTTKVICPGSNTRSTGPSRKPDSSSPPGGGGPSGTGLPSAPAWLTVR